LANFINLRFRLDLETCKLLNLNFLIRWDQTTSDMYGKILTRVEKEKISPGMVVFVLEEWFILIKMYNDYILEVQQY
jgi:hypothetical protein